MTTFVAEAHANYGTTGAVKKVTIPAAAGTGSFLLLQYAGGGTQPDSNPSGWNLLEQKAANNVFATWWWRVATSTDPGSDVTVAAASNAKTTLTLTVWSGASSTTPVAVSASRSDTTSETTHPDPAALALPSGFNGPIIRSLALRDASGANSSTWAPPSGTVRSSTNTGGTATQVVAVQSGGADTTTYTAGSWTVNAATNSAVTLALALNPPTATPTYGVRSVMSSANDGATVTSNNSVLTYSTDQPAQIGDAAFILASINIGTATATSPAGWHTEEIDTLSTNDLKSYLLTKTLTAADIAAGSVTIQWSVTGKPLATGIVMFGLSTVDPTAQVGHTAGTGSPLTAPSVPTHDDYAPVLQFMASTVVGTASAATWPSGWTRQTQVGTAFGGGGGTGPRFASVRVDGGGTIQAIDKHPTTGVIVAGSDTQGFYRSADKGSTWRANNKGMGAGTSSDSQRRQVAAVMWSKTETNTAYAGTTGAFLVGVDDGTQLRWSQRSNAPDFQGNRGRTNDQQSHSRPKGRLFAQDSSYLFAGTYSKGVMRSADNGNTWTACQMNGNAPGTGNWYCRGIIQDPANTSIVYAAFEDTGTVASPNNDGGIWKCTNAHAATPNFVQLTASNIPVTVEELMFVGTYLYAACSYSGIFRSTDDGSTWQNLNGSGSVPLGTGPLDGQGPWWVGIDGYVNGSGAHVIIASSDIPSPTRSGLMSLTIPSNYPTGSITYANLAGNVNLLIAPENRTWWNTSGLNLGGPSWSQGFVLVDKTALPTVDVYVCGRSGTYRSLGGGVNYQLANNGEPCFLGRGIACDPRNKDHLIYTATDWDSFELDDGVGYNASHVFRPTKSLIQGQGCGIAFDPVDSTAYIGGADLKGSNMASSGSDLYFRLAGTNSFTSTGWRAALGANQGIPSAVAAIRDGSNRRVVIGTSAQRGVWRGVYNGTDYTWTRVNNTFCTTNVMIALYEFPIRAAKTAAGGGTPYLYIYDTDKGIYRSSDYGVTWVKVANISTGDPNAAGLWPDPAVPGRVWVTNSTDLYKLTGVHTSTVGSGPLAVGTTGSGTSTAMGVSGRPGVVAMSNNGTNLYLVKQDTGTGSSIVYSTNGGTSWADAVGDDSFAGPAYSTTDVAVAADDQLYFTSANEVAHGYPVPIAPAASSTATNISAAIATLDAPGAAGSYGGDSVAFSGTSPAEHLYTVATQVTTSSNPTLLMFKRTGSTLTAVTLARREGSSVALL